MKPLKTRGRKHLCRINKLHSPTLRQPWRLKCLISVIYTIKALHCGNYLARSSIYAHVYSISCSLGSFLIDLGALRYESKKDQVANREFQKKRSFWEFFFFASLRWRVHYLLAQLQNKDILTYSCFHPTMQKQSLWKVFRVFCGATRSQDFFFFFNHNFQFCQHHQLNPPHNHYIGWKQKSQRFLKLGK